MNRYDIALGKKPSVFPEPVRQNVSSQKTDKKKINIDEILDSIQLYRSPKNGTEQI